MQNGLDNISGQGVFGVRGCQIETTSPPSNESLTQRFETEGGSAGFSRTDHSVVLGAEARHASTVPFRSDIGWKTYNFEVAEHHTYVADGVRVHNNSGILGRIANYINDNENAWGVRKDGFVDKLTDVVGDVFHAVGTVLTAVTSPIWVPIKYALGLNAEFVEDETSLNGVGYYDTWFGRALTKVFGAAKNPSESDGHGGTTGMPSIHETRTDYYGNGGRHDYQRPIILDLDGDGVEISLSQGATFDYDGDGYFEETSWASPDDGFLVIDLNADGTRGAGDGQIDQGREIAFSLWGSDGMTDMEALATAQDANGNLIFDSDGNGVLNDQDTVWNELHVWQDSNQNGAVDANELRTLAEHEIASINLTYDNGAAYGDPDNAVTVLGNTLYGTSSFTRTDGRIVEGGAGDVELVHNTLGYRITEVDNTTTYEFEVGETAVVETLDGTGSADVDLSAAGRDAAIGDTRNNLLSAAGLATSVTLLGNEGDDTLTGGDGDDLIAGGDGADVLAGGAGNDVLYIDADDTGVSGGDGYDVVSVLEFDEYDEDGLRIASGRGINLALDAAGIERVISGDGTDSLFAASTHDIDLNIFGGGGDDTITSGAGDDWISGGEGADVISTGGGDDFLIVDTSDTYDAGEGIDTVYYQTEEDLTIYLFDHNIEILEAGSGNDILHASGSDGEDSQQSVLISAGRGNDRLVGAFGNDQLFGGAGDDIISGDNGTEDGANFSVRMDLQWLSDGSGVFNQSEARAADYDGDGNADFLFAYNGSGRGLTIRTKDLDGDLEYTAHQHVLGDGSAVFNRIDPLVGDFNGDGLDDLVFPWIPSGRGLQIRTKFSDGDGTFTGAVHQTGHGSGVFNSTAPLVGDFNGDALDDLAFVLEINNRMQIRVLHSLGNGLFGGTTTYTPYNDGMIGDAAPLVGDFNGDGLADILFTWRGSNATYLRNYTGQADGTLEIAFTNFGDGNIVYSDSAPRVGDFNGDGRDDFAYLFHDAGKLNIRVRYGQEDGTFVGNNLQFNEARNLFNLMSPNVADYTGDGQDDIAFIYRDGAGETRLQLYYYDEGTFIAAPVTISGIGTQQTSKSSRLFGDFDGNGLQDYAYAFDGSLYSGTASGLHIQTVFSHIAGGDDYLSGGAGSDVISGKAGDDIIIGGLGADVLSGGINRDTFRFETLEDSTAANLDVITDFDSKFDTFDLTSLRRVKFEDLVITETADATFVSVTGEDFQFQVDGIGHSLGEEHFAMSQDIFGTEGSDILAGDISEDRNDVIYGGAGDDTLSGGNLNDWLFGGEGNDTIDGQAGDDVLSGGGGADQFSFSGSFGQDTVTDFEIGIDTLRFEGYVRGDLTLSDDEGDVLIDAANDNSLRLSDLTLAEFLESDFVFA